MQKRTAKIISIKNELLNNDNIAVKIGTVENRDSPQTIYICVGFWVKKKDGIKHDDLEREDFEQGLKDIIRDTSSILKDNSFFPYENENIYICNVPENFNYNDKYNYVSLEFYIHTLNIKSQKKYPLNIKKNTTLFNECLEVAKFISDELKNLEETYNVQKKLIKNI